jgi:hypothetical protein
MCKPFFISFKLLPVAPFHACGFCSANICNYETCSKHDKIFAKYSWHAYVYAGFSEGIQNSGIRPWLHSHILFLSRLLITLRILWILRCLYLSRIGILRNLLRSRGPQSSVVDESDIFYWREINDEEHIQRDTVPVFCMNIFFAGT